MTGNSTSKLEVSYCNDPIAWDCFARKHSELVYFQWRWREVVEAAFGHRPHYLQAKNTNGDIVAILPLFKECTVWSLLSLSSVRELRWHTCLR